MFLINCVALKPVLIFTRRRAARLADSPLMTVVQRGGNGCCSGRGKMRRLENEKYLPRWETIRLVKAALRKATFLVIALASLGHGHVQAAELLWHAYRGADFKPATGQMVQHADPPPPLGPDGSRAAPRP